MSPQLRQQADALFDTVAEGMAPTVRRSAVLSECGVYRYRLERVWDAGKPLVCWCMPNPSTADANQDDPTIRRCMGFARAWGMGGIRVVNLFALRATDPRELEKHPNPVAPPEPHVFWDNLNDAHIIDASDGLELIAAWGNEGAYLNRGRKVRELLNRPVECLGVTKAGEPKHPLYLAASTIPFILATPSPSPASESGVAR